MIIEVNDVIKFLNNLTHFLSILVTLEKTGSLDHANSSLE